VWAVRFVATCEIDCKPGSVNFFACNLLDGKVLIRRLEPPDRGMHGVRERDNVAVRSPSDRLKVAGVIEGNPGDSAALRVCPTAGLPAALRWEKGSPMHQVRNGVAW
jgi:hypothetical protein